MSFETAPEDRFAKVFERADYETFAPLVKANIVQRGGNIIFGRSGSDQQPGDLIYVGKVIEHNNSKNILGFDAWLDTKFPHVIYITGTRGSGKSFDLGVLIEGIAQLRSPSPVQLNVSPIASFLIDTQSQFWTLAYPPNPNVPENRQQLTELERWNVPPNALANCKLFIPPGTTPVTGDEVVFTIAPSQVSHEEWCALVGQDVYSPQGHILSETLLAFGDRKFTLRDMITHIEDDSNWGNVSDVSRNVLVYKLSDYDRTGLFAADGLSLTDLIVPGQCNVFLLRELRNSDKALVTGLIARQLFDIMGDYHTRRKRSLFFNQPFGARFPSRVWLLVDEAHVVAPADETSAAKAPLIEYVKRGRDAGLSLVLATQQPSAVDSRILSQVNVTLGHRLVFQRDISSAVDRVPAKLLPSIKHKGTDVTEFGDMLRSLDAGQCFIGEHNTSRVVLLQIRPRISSHGGYSPV
jgi:hypothetical protein